ncbi:NIPSNAP family protein [Pseudoxanthomonas indica]|uniref:NIPSNAP protein n=1 Tax=Pseudoxanthomonas indica TaxID=428993 RepID=A0A1T5KPA0_9GAMM|nr:NIPSNAP family protein [Pseudoxanthomonas indica]GGD50344.1 NIPSNAP family containing protein [Pseudoxanthomonas indica]SKC65118.1 NIPSNAP protein [Pseudoxanthomonas indica]
MNAQLQDMAVAPRMRAGAAATSQHALGVIELRQYTLHPGRRDELISLFESEFIDTQEATGMTLLGQFRDLDDPDRFVWLRGFADMDHRRESLAAFYQGAAWQQHRNAANATMIDSDNVLLLRPGADIASGIALPLRQSGEPDESRIVIGLHYFDAPVGEDWLSHFEQVQRPWLEDLRAQVVATLVSEYAPNDFPALPVREGEHVFACVLRFASEADHERCDRQLQASWHIGSQPRRHELLRLAPTSLSRLGR